MKKCYYEVLELEPCGASSADEIRKSYRRLALQLHPDKSRGSVDEVTSKEAFQELQEAYECLSDPQERAWYDSHKSQILGWNAARSGSDDAGGSTDDPSKINLWRYFSRSCYRNFDDEEGVGFFFVFSQLFKDIVNEQLSEQVVTSKRQQQHDQRSDNSRDGCCQAGSEQESRGGSSLTGQLPCVAGGTINGEYNDAKGQKHMKSSCRNSTHSGNGFVASRHTYTCSPEVCSCDIPLFGSSSSSWAEVTKFYRYWQEFSSSRSFNFADQYNMNTAENRFVRRKMEQENAKRRKAARKEFNDKIRSLVSFVKKRDPRNLARARQLVEEQQKQTERLQQLRRRAEAHKLENRRRLREEEEERWRQIDMEKAAKELEELQQRVGPVPVEVGSLSCPVTDGVGAPREERVSRNKPWQDDLSEESDSDACYVYKCELCNKQYKSLKQWEAHGSSKKHKKLLSCRAQGAFTVGSDNAPTTCARGRGHSLSILADLDAKESPVISDVRDALQSRKSSMDGVSADGSAQDRRPNNLQLFADKNRSNPHYTGGESSSRSESSADSTFWTASYGQKSKKRRDVLSNDGESTSSVGHNLSENEGVGSEIAARPELSNSYSKVETASVTGSTCGNPEACSASRTSTSVSLDVVGYHKCAVCGELFPSRTKLFAHVNSVGHAVPVPSTGSSSSRRGKTGTSANSRGTSGQGQAKGSASLR
eukprot:GHVQ01023083.1.p1 GENE.GHVQ01023083.1~~GHVQ01023083.1.p1  ORF type:complete len:707 (+),score=89.19 GHVQ01023083.1:269-2389(+)